MITPEEALKSKGAAVKRYTKALEDCIDAQLVLYVGEGLAVTGLSNAPWRIQQALEDKYRSAGWTVVSHTSGPHIFYKK